MSRDCEIHIHYYTFDCYIDFETSITPFDAVGGELQLLKISNLLGECKHNRYSSSTVPKFVKCNVFYNLCI